MTAPALVVLTEAVAELQRELDEIKEQLNRLLRASGGLGTVEADARYVKKSGDTMTGELAAPTVALDDYIDVGVGGVPANPAADKLRLYVEDYKGFPFYSFRDSTGMVRKIVRDSVFVGKNVTGSTILKFRAVYATGSADDVPTLGLARADSIDTMPSIGVTVEDIVDGAFGRVMQVGLIENTNTSAYPVGSVIYVSATVAGAGTATAPVYPNIAQEIGTVLVSATAANGGMFQCVARSMMNSLGDLEHPQYLPIDGSGAMTGHLLPNVDDTYYLGSPTKNWLELYLKRFSVDQLGNATLTGSLTITSALSAATTTLQSTIPALDNTYDLGLTATRWSRLYLSQYLYTGITTLPAANSTYRGALGRTEGGAGTADKLYMCMKLADDSYSWVQII